jgi:tetratricopeptide (TPR) repeat protein
MLPRPIVILALTASIAAGQADEPQPTTSTSRPSPSDVPLIDQALSVEMSGEYSRAIELYRSVIDQPDHTPSLRGEAAWIGLSRCLAETGEYESAIDALRSCPEDARGPAWRAAMTRLLGFVGQYEEAIKLAEGTLRLSPRHYETAYWLARWLDELGRRDELLEKLDWATEIAEQPPPREPAECMYAGLLLQFVSVELGMPGIHVETVLQNFYQKTYEEIDRRYWPARVAAGRLLLEKYNIIQAREDFEAALEINPRCIDALIGLAEADLVGWAFEKVEQRLNAATAINPNHPRLHLAWAKLRMTERRYKEAAITASEGLKTNPAHIELLSILAAARIRAGDASGAGEAIELTEETNSRPWRLHQALGDWLAAGRQFDSAEKHFLRAVELAPHRPEPTTALGMMYIQIGENEQARRRLEQAWALDPFNRKTKNSLDLLDSLRDEFERIETEHFIVRFDPDTDAATAPYFADFLEEIYPQICEDFQAYPSKKTLVEIYPTHGKFAVRITALPWIPTIGASTGRIVAISAPRRGAAGRLYNWARVLRHEFTHTVTLAATENRIPHWYTEGLAVMSEEAPRPWEWIKALNSAVQSDGLLRLDAIDWAFVRPKKTTDRQLAYAQSHWMCEYVVERFGYDALLDMLRNYREGKTQPEVFQLVTNLSQDQFFDDFREWAKQESIGWNVGETSPLSVVEAQALLSSPPTADELAELAAAQIAARMLAQGEQTARKVLDLNKDHPRGLEILAVIYAVRSTDPRASEDRQEELLGLSRGHFQRLAEIDPNSTSAIRALSHIARDQGNHDEAIYWFKRLRTACPRDPTSDGGLAGIYLDRGHDELALPHLARLGLRAEYDPISALRSASRVASIYRDKGDYRQAIRWYTEAIQINPYEPSYHIDLGDAFASLEKTNKALKEYEIALGLAPDPKRTVASDPAKARQDRRFLLRLAEAFRQIGEESKAEEAEAKASFQPDDDFNRPKS